MPAFSMTTPWSKLQTTSISGPHILVTCKHMHSAIVNAKAPPADLQVSNATTLNSYMNTKAIFALLHSSYHLYSVTTHLQARAAAKSRLLSITKLP